MDNAECTPFSPVVSCPPDSRYALPGPQVEPDAAYWTAGPPCTIPRVVQISELIALTDDPDNRRCHFKPYPCNEEVVQKEIQELKELASLRDDPNAIA